MSEGSDEKLSHAIPISFIDDNIPVGLEEASNNEIVDESYFQLKEQLIKAKEVHLNLFKKCVL